MVADRSVIGKREHYRELAPYTAVAHDVELRYRVLLVEAVELLHRLVKVQASFLRLQQLRKKAFQRFQNTVTFAARISSFNVTSFAS